MGQEDRGHPDQRDHKRDLEDRNVSEDLDNLTLEEAWLLAIRKEQEAQELYRGLVDKVDVSGAKDLFLFLLEQEKVHERRLQDEFDRAFRAEW